VSTILLATVYMFLHNMLNVLVQTVNKMGLQKKTAFLGRNTRPYRAMNKITKQSDVTTFL
jgi:hypothetical protein